MYEYGALKPVKVILEGEGRGRIMEGILHAYMKSHNEIPCMTTI
jgi:hypothetical protein